MLETEQFKNEDVLQQNCKIGKKHPKCSAGKLCHPQGEFDMVESCKSCKKII